MSVHPSLKYNQFTKITLGASFNDVEALKRIVFVYSIAGADCFDIGAREVLVSAAREAIDEAQEYCITLSKKFVRPHIVCSVDLSYDPHFMKAVVTSKESANFDEKIRSVCPTEAILEDRIIANLCIGCGKCVMEPYPIKLVSYSHVEDVANVVDALITAGADGIEYHIGILPTEAIDKNLAAIKKYLNKDIAFSIGSGIHNTEKCKKILDQLHKQKIREVLIQADGQPMSANNDYNSSLQSVMLVKELMEYSKKKWYKFYFQLSGGTNQYSRRLSIEHGIDPHGIGWGTYARKAIADGINIEDEVQKAKGLLYSWRNE